MNTSNPTAFGYKHPLNCIRADAHFDCMLGNCCYFVIVMLSETLREKKMCKVHFS